MIDYTSKREAMEKFDAITRPLSNETYLQINMVGVDWLFIQANETFYINVTLDVMDNALRVMVHNKVTDREQSYRLNLRRPTTDALKEKFINLQNERVYGIS